MALRLYSEFTSHNGKDYKIEIHDSNWGLSASSFVVASDGFTLNYSGETDDIVSPIISSNCTISAYNNSSVFDLFISDLKKYQEERFTLKIGRKVDEATIRAVSDYFERVEADGGTYEAGECLKFAIEQLGGVTDTAQAYYILSLYKYRVEQDGGTVEGDDCVVNDLQELGLQENYFTFWTGSVMQDLITIEDTHKPYVFSITAVDGIGQLSNKEYALTSNTTIKEFLQSAAEAIGTTHLYNNTDTFLATTVNTWDSQHVYNAVTDVTTLTRFTALVYADKEEDGTLVYSNYLDILKELCIAFGARFYQREGAFIFEQYLERADAARQVFSYDKNGSLLVTAEVSDDLRLDQTTDGARLAGNQFNFLPALKKVQVSYNQERSNNLLANRLTYTGATGRQDLGFVVDDNNGKIQVTGQLIYELNHNGNAGTVVLEFWRPVWQLELRIEDAANPGTFYYLKRDWSPSGGQLYGATSWTTTASYYHIDAGIGKNDTSGAYISSSFSLVTPPLPVDGDAELDVNYYRAYDLNNNLQTIPVYFDETNQVKEVTATYFNDNGGISNVTVYSATNTDSTINSNLILDLGELRVSDSTGLQGSFYVYNGSTWVPSTQWRRGNSGSYTSLLKLLTNELLALHKKPIERYSGTIVGSQPFGIRYYFDGGYWLPMSGTYNANMDEWSSEWFKIEKDLTNITVATPVGSGGGADFVGRVSSQQGTDEIINAISISTTDMSASSASVTGTLDAGKVDSDTVQLLGGSGTQGTMEWNVDENTVELITNGSSHMLGQDMVYNVKNQSGSTIDKGVAVMAVGTLGSSGRILINRASAAGDIPARFFLGVTAESIADGADGKVIEFGKIRGLDTSAYADGTVLWLDPAVSGGFTPTEPTAPNLKIATAFVVHQHATQGVIMVRANQGHKLADAHDVNISGLADGDILRWDNDLGYWYNTPFPG